MVGVFGYIYLVLYPRLSGHYRASSWPAAAVVLNSIRRLVAVNLMLAACTVVAAIFK